MLGMVDLPSFLFGEIQCHPRCSVYFPDVDDVFFCVEHGRPRWLIRDLDLGSLQTSQEQPHLKWRACLISSQHWPSWSQYSAPRHFFLLMPVKRNNHIELRWRYQRSSVRWFFQSEHFQTDDIDIYYIYIYIHGIANNKLGVSGTNICICSSEVMGWNASHDPPIGKYGACCAEMDIWEANSRATAYTPPSDGLKRWWRSHGMW